MKMMKLVHPQDRRSQSSVVAVVVLIASLMIAMFSAPAQAAIVYISQSSGGNDALPTDQTPGALTIPAPAGVAAGRALIASIASRPQLMTVTVPPGWILMTSTNQPSGGVSTLPQGMNLSTYYKIATVSEPASYTWTFANEAGSGPNYGGSAVGGILLFSGVDTAGGTPINVWSARLTASGTTHATNSITPTLTNTMIVSSISFLSSSTFANPTGIAGITERLDVAAPPPNAAIGTTLQMSTAPWATATATGASQAVAASDADTGVGHLMALKPSLIDLDISMVRSGPLIPGGTASYTMSVINNGLNSEPGPLTIVTTLPAGLSHTTYSGTGWVCGAPSGQTRTCTRTGAIAAGATAPNLVLDVSVSAGATGTLTNTATVSGTGGDGNLANNTAQDSYTFATDLAITKARVGALNPGQNGTYTLTVSNVGTLSEAGPITITDVLPVQLTYVSAVGTGWSCGVSVQTVTCTRVGALSAGAAAATVTLTVAVSATASSVSNTASVAGTSGDGNGANNSSTDNYSMLADLSLTKTRGGPLVPGSNATYTLTVTNAGPNAAPQPITITDTLPGTLTYVSATGPGWTCNGTVSCTLTGPLASGASSSVVLTVTVAGGTAGSTITNTALVSGTANDGNLADNTGSDSYFIPIQSYAYYAMDEASWPASPATNQVIDSSGNNRHADALGGITTLATPASGLKGDTCRGTDIPDNNLTNTIEAVDTKINVNSLGNAGTISFWYRSRRAWNTGSGASDDRTLFDATPAGGNGEFWFALEDNGRLYFRLDNATNSRQNVRTNTINRAAGTWVHLAVTWNFTTGSMCIFVDGVADAAGCVSGSGNITSNNNYVNLVIGDNAGAYTANPNRGNSADGRIDEVRLYNFDMNAAQITADMNATHSCVSVDHYELSLPASSLSCLATPVTVTACADSSSPCTNPYAPASGTTASLSTSGGTLGATTVTFNASGIATTTLSFPAAANGTPATVTLSGEALPAANPRRCIQGASSVVANSCTTTFNTAGFIFSDTLGGVAATLPAQVAGVSSSTYYLRAVRTSTTTQACEAALSGANTVNFAYECNNPTTCSSSNLMSVNGGSATTIARNNNGSVSSYTSVPMTFDANGNAPFTFNYSDVGQVTLYANKAAGGSLLSALAGSSNAFVAKPHHFDLSAIQCTIADAANCAPGALPSGNNPAAANAAGASFIQAGKPFSVTVTARDFSGNATRNYGREIAPEGVRLDRTPVASTGPSNPALVTTGFGAFSNGVATGTDFVWNEVGIITLTPGIGDGNYLDAGDVTGTTSGNVGRFIPNHFDVTPLIHGCTGGANFTYSAQPFGQLTVTAKAAGNTVTSNYNGGFARDVALSDANGSTAGTFSNGTFLATGFANGTQFQSNVSYAFTDKETAPVILALRATDTDNVSSAGHTEEVAPIRSGRVNIFNAYGSELTDLRVPMRIEYYEDTVGPPATTGWIVNGADTCSNLALSILLSNYQGNLSMGETCVHDTGSPGVSGQGCAAPGPLVPVDERYRALPSIAAPPPVGSYNLYLKAPGPTNTGSVDISANLTTKPWLLFDWDDNGTPENPTGQASFGLFQGSPRHIYLRERY